MAKSAPKPLQPPHNHEAEMSVLGAALLSKRAAEEIAQILRRTDFHSPAHAEIFERIKFLVLRETTVDLVTLKDALGVAGKLSEVGGVEYLVQIAEAVPSAVNAAYYAEIVRDRSIRRQMEDSGQRLIQEAHRYEIEEKGVVRQVTGNEVLAKAIDRLETISSRSLPVDPWVKTFEVDVDKPAIGIPVGLPTIEDYTTCRGLPGGQVTVVQAGTNVGKTPFLTQMAYDVARRGGRVCYALFADLTPTQWMHRLVKLATGSTEPPLHDLEANRIWSERRDALLGPTGEAATILIYNGRGASQQSQIETFSRQLILEHSISPFEFVAIDYLQKVGTASASESRYDRVSYVSDKITGLAEALGDACAVAVGSQITEDVRTGKSWARFGQEAMSDAGFGVEIRKTSEGVELWVTKNRFGASKCMLGYGWEFDTRFLRFIDPKLDRPAA